MSHIVGKEAYKSLEERLNQFPQGAASSETLYKILSLLFSPEEAKMAALLPVRPFNIKRAAKVWNLSEYQTELQLEKLCSKGVLLDLTENGTKTYFLPPPMVGFFEFSMMRTRGDLDQKLLSQLYHQYLNVEEDFIKDLFFSTETKFGRAFVQEGVLTHENAIHVLDFERTSYLVENATDISLSMCYCRHKMHHMGHDCYAPMETCMTFGTTARSLSKQGYGRLIDTKEAMDIIHMAQDYNLVQCGENVRDGGSFLCNCCGCCCEAMTTAKRFGLVNPIETTAFIPTINEDTCIRCGKCQKVCPIDCIEAVPSLNEKPISIKHNGTKLVPNPNLCLGCGVCVRNCPNKSITLLRREKQILTPANTTHRTVLMAIEKGTLPQLIFDNGAYKSHRVMAAVLSVILNLPPVKQALASKQLKSVYLDHLLSKKQSTSS